MCIIICVFMKSKGNLIMWSKFKKRYIYLAIPGYSNQMYLLLVLGYDYLFFITARDH